MKGLIEEDNENLGSNLACKLSNSLRAICYFWLLSRTTKRAGREKETATKKKRKKKKGDETLVGKEIIGKKGDPFSWCYWAPKNKTVGKAFNSFFKP